MKAKVKWTGYMSFVGESGSGHCVSMDGAPEAGGRNLAPRPMEMVLMGLGGCSSFDIVKMLKAAGQDVRDVEIRLEAERADTEPAVFTRIRGHFTVSGHAISDDEVRKAVRASAEKHSSVSKMLEKTADIKYDYEIVEL
ncbi:MAG: OsmC family protein [Gammaproteobacteria bacterium]|nr:OsmC family protein [Gammaproteobacteria bacterium]MDD9806956.1 OsmC family protein [Gammaproteobacteria bacterium]MDD9869264.1 OsmC family protein [Gammaproteobacteria bacterium]MDD9886621.1 OsmC family protein [Gammaproteobacteria bacterium]